MTERVPVLVALLFAGSCYPVDVVFPCANTVYVDADGDGWGAGDPVLTEECELPDGYSAAFGDCDDRNVAVTSTGAQWFPDQDGDGAGDPEQVVAACDAPGPGYVTYDTDCDDTDAGVAQGMIEHCDGRDEDCDGEVDEDGVDPIEWYPDEDGDGYGRDSALEFGCPPATDWTTEGGDCNDADPDRHPGADEVCNSRDDDCDDQTDEDAVDPILMYADTDGDGFGDPGEPTWACDGSEGVVDNSTDCDDRDASVSPGASEVCDDGVDNDCDGTRSGCALGDLSLSSASARYLGEDSNDQAGCAVTGAGDVDGDGYDDIVVGAKGSSSGAAFGGAAYLVLGGQLPAIPQARVCGRNVLRRGRSRRCGKFRHWRWGRGRRWIR